MKEEERDEREKEKKDTKKPEIKKEGGGSLTVQGLGR
jgi:hypothetical protein